MKVSLLNKPRTVKIVKIKKETPTVKSIFFRDEFCSKAKPGQFIMVWIPGLDEVPMSLSYMETNKGISAITVKVVGEATEAIHKLEKGAMFGVRGPYGNGFKIFGGKVLVVGGGIGVAPLLPLVRHLKKVNVKPTVVIGAKNKEELVFVGEMKKILGKRKVLTVTEDGSEGLKGFASDVLADLLEKDSYKMVYACGPEAMLKKVLDLVLKHKVQAQLSLERYMKCGVGICGSCMIDGFRVCKDGPVFSSKTLIKTKEFGFLKRTPSGKTVPIE